MQEKLENIMFDLESDFENEKFAFYDCFFKINNINVPYVPVCLIVYIRPKLNGNFITVVHTMKCKNLESAPNITRMIN